jgi:hypothetical protein
MGKVVARFYVSGVEKRPDGTAEVSLMPCVSKENAHWAEYTPAGTIKMSLTRKASGALDVFEGAVDRARARNADEIADGKKARYYQPECLVTFDFDAGYATEDPPRYVSGEGYKPD